jgi:hypothetical protein
MEHWWYDTDEGKMKYPDKNLSRCHFVHPQIPHELTWDRPQASEWFMIFKVTLGWTLVQNAVRSKPHIHSFICHPADGQQDTSQAAFQSDFVPLKHENKK